MITINLATVFCVMAFLSSALCIAAIVALYRQIERLRARCDAAEAGVQAAQACMPAMQRELELMASVSAKTGSRVNRIESDYSGVADRVDQVEMRGAPQSFDLAIDFARRGGDIGQLVQRFGMSRGEAELVVRMHGVKRRA